MGRGRPKGSTNSSGHSAGGRRPGSGPKVKNPAKAEVLGKRKGPQTNNEKTTSSSQQRKPTPEPSQSRSPSPSTTDPEVSDHDRESSQKLGLEPVPQTITPVNYHPLFRKQISAQVASQSTATPTEPRLPHVPVIIPEDLDNPNNASIPSDLVDSSKAAAHDSNISTTRANGTNSPDPEDTPVPEGVVKQFLENTRKAVEKQIDLHGQPDCYRVNQTFWITPPNRWFALQKPKSTSTAVGPELLYHPRVFVWVPDTLLPADFVFRCPTCGSGTLGKSVFSSFSDKNGFAGFSPSRWYLNQIYMDYMGHVKPHQDQAMAAVSATLVRWDRSYKAIKYIARLDGVRVFGSLWTMTNEHEQVRQMLFTPTDHLYHIEQPLRDVVRSLHEHGHEPISFLWTDNVAADRQFAERVIPTLRVGVNSDSTTSSIALPPATIPNDLNVHLASSLHLIDLACSSIMSNVGDETTDQKIVVGFSIEWDWQASKAGHFPAAMMQISLNTSVNLLQIYHIQKPEHVPESLKALLLSKRVLKVGYHVQGNLDLLSLLWELRSSPEQKINSKATGWIDLGALAKSKGLIPHAAVSFRQISEAILRRNLDDQQDVRCSDWCRPDISDDQRQYAVRNAWVSLAIYKAIVDRPPAGARLAQIGLPGKKVTVRNGDMSVAHGFFAVQPTKIAVTESDPDTKYITISRTRRAVITIQEILTPSFICHYHDRALEDMGRPPFDIAVDLNSLIAREEYTIHPLPPVHNSENSTAMDVDSEAEGLEAPISESHDSPLMDSEPEDFESESESDQSDAEFPAALDSEDFAQNTVMDVDEFNDPETDALISAYEDPLDAPPHANHPLIQPSDDSAPKPTRTFQDVWHLMGRVTKKIEKRHSLGKQFARWLRDAMLIPDKIDKAQVEAVLKRSGIIWNQAVRSRPDWVWARVRRYIPPPDVLEPILKKLFKTHADLRCSQHKIRLFEEGTHHAAEALLSDVRKGWVSDPAGVALYNKLRIDGNGLTVWHCDRGSNSLEGGVHRPVRDRFGSLGASVEMSVALLSDFCYRKNVESGSRHKEGVEYNGHYDPWIEDDIDIVYQSLPFDTPRKTRPGYVNVSLFKPTHESFILTKLPQDVCDEYDIPRNPETTSNSGLVPSLPLVDLSGARTNRYKFLASAQNIKFALTPIHTNQEYALFNKALRTGGPFAAANGKPDFKKMALWWSSKVNGNNVFYKMKEHLQSHFKTWNAVRVEMTTLQLTENDREEFMEVIQSEGHTSLVLDESYSPVRACSAEAHAEAATAGGGRVPWWKCGKMVSVSAAALTGSLLSAHMPECTFTRAWDNLVFSI
ncbi:hypothetical protein FB451DRAFT_1498462 [Mycena latifolia]|nr:hypothetical protein FB451DRAFT_1498462 [Mycena latifolia]